MASFGENLRREREMRGITLQEISQASKISARMLDAIETGRFERLPGGVFNRGFVRQYARYLGLDEEHVLAEFEMACAATPESAEGKKPAPILPAAWAQLKTVEDESARHSANLPLRIAVGILMMAAVAIGGWRWLGNPDSGRRATRTVESPPVIRAKMPPPSLPAPETPAADPTSTETPAQAGAALLAEGLRLRLDATSRVAYTVVVDDGPQPQTGVLRSRGWKAFAAQKLITVEVDNAGAVVVTLNGETMPPLGGRQERAKARYTRANLKGTGGQQP